MAKDSRRNASSAPMYSCNLHWPFCPVSWPDLAPTSPRLRLPPRTRRSPRMPPGLTTEGRASHPPTILRARGGEKATLARPRRHCLATQFFPARRRAASDGGDLDRSGARGWGKQDAPAISSSHREGSTPCSAHGPPSLGTVRSTEVHAKGASWRRAPVSRDWIFPTSACFPKGHPSPRREVTETHDASSVGTPHATTGRHDGGIPRSPAEDLLRSLSPAVRSERVFILRGPPNIPKETLMETVFSAPLAPRRRWDRVATEREPCRNGFP